jgi:hypothetical protein
VLILGTVLHIVSAARRKVEVDDDDDMREGSGGKKSKKKEDGPSLSDEVEFDWSKAFSLCSVFLLFILYFFFSASFSGDAKGVACCSVTGCQFLIPPKPSTFHLVMHLILGGLLGAGSVYYLNLDYLSSK